MQETRLVLSTNSSRLDLDNNNNLPELMPASNVNSNDDSSSKFLVNYTSELTLGHGNTSNHYNNNTKDVEHDTYAFSTCSATDAESFDESDALSDLTDSDMDSQYNDDNTEMSFEEDEQEDMNGLGVDECRDETETTTIDLDASARPGQTSSVLSSCSI